MMDRDWICDAEGQNLKFKREALLNYGMNRWGLNKAQSVGPTSELIRECSPKSFEGWEKYYFNNARQKKRDGIRISREFITELGRKLYVKLTEVVQSELADIEEAECIDYVYNLVLNRTYEGYRSEVDTIYGQLEGFLGVKIHPAPDEWDRMYNVDFHIEVLDRNIGLQVKPIASGRALDHYQWDKMHEENHRRFTEKFGGRVFFVYSVKSGKKKQIYNVDVIDEIKNEMARLKN